MEHKNKKIAIIGSRGIPASYGGFETSVEETGKRFVKHGFDVEIYCRSNHYSEKLNSYKGAGLVYVWSPSNKYLNTIISTLFSIIKLDKKRTDIIILYGLGNAIFLPLVNMFSIPVITVVDGADWKRSKWGFFSSSYLKLNSFIAIKFSKNVVVDSKIIQKKYKEKLKFLCDYIPYGYSNEKIYDKKILKKYSLYNKKYILFVGRFEKEKGIEFLINNFNQIESDTYLVIIGGNKANRKYEDYIKSLGNQKVKFLGFIYDEDYINILKYSLFYVSTSFIEGTSPSLLTAMGVNGFALVSDIEENIETLHDTCSTFKTGDGNDFTKKLLYYIKNKKNVDIERIKTKSVVKEYYSWDSITNDYLSHIYKFID